ncbi:MAG TPA: prolyl oligopeptidase family serine peptidase [Blastocatellia bacterium]|nr:prolyl oligopeptidase family serine peptidase [Blastocatellia bacterium]
MLRGKTLRFVFTLFAVLPLALASALAQDSSQVLRTSVGFTTLKNSVPMDDEKKKQVAELEAKAQKANGEKRYGDALRHLQQGMALMRGQAWTPAYALGTATQIKADRVVADPGDVVKLTVTQVFTLEEPLSEKLNGTLTIAPPRNRDPQAAKELKTLQNVEGNFLTTPLQVEGKLPEIADGEYVLTLTLKTGKGETINKTAPIHIARGLVQQQKSLRADAAKAASKYSSNDEMLRALAAVEYQLSIPDLVSTGQITGARDFKKEMATAAAYLDQIQKGQNPLRTMKGDFRWAYRSDVDKTLQPYRVFVPSNYDPAKPTPMVVALHGMGGDENSYFTNYDNGVIKREAEARGYLVVCPKGRGTASMYAGDAEKDVLDVIAAMKRDYNVDTDRVYLTGHSMGGYGTWSIAPKHPELFAAIAPIAGGGNPQALSKIKHVPQIVVHGDKDPTVPVERSRVMVKAAQELGIKLKYIEVPGGNHSDIVVPNQKAIFDWFDAHKRQPMAKATGAGSQ